LLPPLELRAALNRFVADLLDLSRIRAGALPLDLQIVAAEDLVGAALQRLASVPGSDRIEVELPSDGTLPVARMDFVQSLRVLCNLLENALKHAAGEAVRLEITLEGEALVLRVLDRGSGVAIEDLERIFDPFFQGRKSERKGSAGAGLGLAIARSLAEAQGGAVHHLPRSGGGSVFEFRLPAESIPD
jgi:two-component system sensor histidine kinase KdpD